MEAKLDKLDLNGDEPFKAQLEDKDAPSIASAHGADRQPTADSTIPETDSSSKSSASKHDAELQRISSNKEARSAVSEQAACAPPGMDPEVLKRIAAFAGRTSRIEARPTSRSPAPGFGPAALAQGGMQSRGPLGGLAAKRAGVPQLKLSGPPGISGVSSRRSAPKLDLNRAPGGETASQNGFSKYADVVDAATGSLKFKGAVLSSEGVNFGNGREYKARLQDFEKLDELGRGNYGTVWRVVHKVTKVQMAMKEIRLALEEAVFSQIIMELDVLHKAQCPEIVEFYGAFFVEGCVYILMEFMDAGSLEKIYTTDIAEGVLAKITLSTVRGLRTLKDRHNIIHRDVKPTNILVNGRGQVKLCDFGVSGNLVASIAKTNIGCQSYMAPERIRSENAASGPSTYTVQSDIWSLGLSILELAKGGYPYPPETYNNIFAQLQAICDGEPPDLPQGRYSEEARDFVRQCLAKDPRNRPPYSSLLRHPWLLRWADAEVDMAGWVSSALAKTREEKASGNPGAAKPAMHSINPQVVRNMVA